jgi:sec-independent protein translocase protein TatC
MKSSLFYYFKEAQLRPLYILISFGACFLASYLSSQEIFHLLTTPLLPLEKDLIFTDMSEGLYTTLKISAFTSFLFISPLFVYQSWAFFAPSWYLYERKMYRLHLSLVLLFLGGSLFSVYSLLLPKGSEYLFYFSIPNQPLCINMELRVGSYVSFALYLLLGGVFLGQVPLLLSLGLSFCNLNPFLQVNPERRGRGPFSLVRKILFLFSLLLASFLGPADFLLQSLLTALFLSLFEVGVYLYCFYNRYLKAPSFS